jgi:hypothetical protein
MKQPIILLLILLSVLTWWSLQTARQGTVDNGQLERDRQQKQLIDQARERKDIAALEAFIRENPDSGWRDVAIFYRDEFAYRQAVAKGDPKSLEQYILLYPQSQWRSFAEQRLEQFRREEQARLSRIERQRKLAGKPLPLPAAGAQAPIPEQPASQAIISPPKPLSPDPRERVQRALSIYQQQREQKQFDARQQQQRKQAEQEQQRNCMRLRDQLRQFDSNIRWYQLDADGKRVFLDEQQVRAKRRETENYLKRHCR